MPVWHRYGVPGVDRSTGRGVSRFGEDREARTADGIPLRSAQNGAPYSNSPIRSRSCTRQIERLIEASGRQWTFLRPGMIAANARWWWAPQIRAGDVVRWPYLAVPTAPIDERDIAAAAVRALSEDGHAGAEYVLTGPQSLSASSSRYRPWAM